MFQILEACCVLGKKVHWFCMCTGFAMWILSFILFITLFVNLVQVVVLKAEYGEVSPCVVLAQEFQRKPCTGSGCRYLYLPYLLVGYSIACSSGPQCNNSQEFVNATAYETPDPVWYSNFELVQQYFMDYPTGSVHSCYYKKSQVNEAVMTNNARFLSVSSVLRFIFMFGFVVAGSGMAFWGCRRYHKKKAKAELKELKSMGKLGKAQAKYGTFQAKKLAAKKGKKKSGKADKIKRLGQMAMEVV